MASRLTPVSEPGAPRLIVTDGGPHPADVWAQVTAEHIMPLGDDISGTRRAAAMAAQAKLMAALEPLYDAAQKAERDRLAADHDALMAPPASNEFVGSAVMAARDALSGTEWTGMMDDAERVAAVRMALAQHHATAVFVERGWHVDGNPEHPHAAAFNAMRGVV